MLDEYAYNARLHLLDIPSRLLMFSWFNIIEGSSVEDRGEILLKSLSPWTRLSRMLKTPKTRIHFDNVRGSYVLPVIARESHDAYLKCRSLLEFIMVCLQSSRFAHRESCPNLSKREGDIGTMESVRTQEGGRAYNYRFPIVGQNVMLRILHLRTLPPPTIHRSRPLRLELILLLREKRHNTLTPYFR